MKRLIAVLYVSLGLAHGPMIPPDPWAGGYCTCCGSTCPCNPKTNCTYASALKPHACHRKH